MRSPCIEGLNATNTCFMTHVSAVSALYLNELRYYAAFLRVSVTCFHLRHREPLCKFGQMMRATDRLVGVSAGSMANWKT